MVVGIVDVVDFYGGQPIRPHERGTDVDASSSRHVPFSRHGEKQTTETRLVIDTHAAHCGMAKEAIPNARYQRG